MFTNKRTKEPIIPHKSPEGSWKNISVDLFGTMPDQRHIVVALDSASRFTAAKIVTTTAATPVIKALDNIYTDYGQPISHRTDNGPPFISEEFTKHTNSKGIEHVKTYPYHLQANPAETFMKPLGKTMKAACYNNTDKEEALKQLLISYISTPHPTKGEPPGAIMFRNGYNSDFPRRAINDEAAEAAFQRDKNKKSSHRHNINSSKHCEKSSYTIGDKVYIRNHIRSKFEPLFGPETFKVISLGNGGA